MSEKEFYTLRVYGEAGRREQIWRTVSGLFCFGTLMGNPADDATQDHAAIRFEWAGESVVELVKEVSRRMPKETFDLCVERSSEPAEPRRQVIVAGQALDAPSPVYNEEQELPLWHPLELDLVLLPGGSVDLPATVIVNNDRVYRDVADDIVFPLHWKARMEMNMISSEIASLESLLTPAESVQVTQCKEEHKRKVEKLAARVKASNSLQETASLLADPHVAR